MRDTNNWIWDNIVLVIMLNIILGALVTIIVVRHVYKLVKKQQISSREWLVLIITLVFGLMLYVLTGINNSPISL